MAEIELYLMLLKYICIKKTPNTLNALVTLLYVVSFMNTLIANKNKEHIDTVLVL